MKISDNINNTSNIGSFSKIMNIFFEPKKVFESLLISRSNLIAISLLITISLLLVVVKLPHIEKQTMEVTTKLLTNENFIKTTPGFSEDMAEKQIEIGVKASKISALFTPILYLIFMFIQALIFNGIFKLLKGQGSLKQTFSVLLYSYFIVLLGDITKTISTLFTGNIEAGNSLAFLLNGDKTNFIYNLISNIDFFYIWALIIMGIGFSIIHKITTKKSLYVVFGVWGIIIMGYVMTITMQAISYYDKYGIIL